MCDIQCVCVFVCVCDIQSVFVCVIFRVCLCVCDIQCVCVFVCVIF